MKHFIAKHSLPIRLTVFLTSLIFVVLLIVLLVETHPVNALPEYATLTGESCGVCHVNPGGGGPRTLRGLLWAARGKPVQLPALPPVLLAPDVKDSYELYRIACAGCHGTKGEGSSAMSLTGTGIHTTAVRSYLLKGIQPLGMPGFKGQLTDAQVDGLVNFVTILGDSTVPLPPDSYPLAPAQLQGKPGHAETESEGN